MSNLWDTPPWIKLHEGCGGRVRWVEAIEVPGVGYYGKCDECGETGIVTEDIIPLYDGDDRAVDSSLGDRIEEAGIGVLRSLEWDDDESHAENQRRLAEIIIDAT